MLLPYDWRLPSRSGIASFDTRKHRLISLFPQRELQHIFVAELSFSMLQLHTLVNG